MQRPSQSHADPLAIRLAKVMLQRLRVGWSGFSLKRLPPIKPTSMVLPLLLVGAVILGVYPILLTENAHRSSRPAVAGWDEIDECGSLTSWDGTKTLDFERNHRASVSEKPSDEADKSERKVDGIWSFDAEKDRYIVAFKDSRVDYELVKPEDSSVCILAPGDISAANLRESWFGRIKDE
jgi:hypothetical protein